ncbi:MAG: hypothetical protein HEQ35_15670 [Gloeotrichia echinulata IR180]
MHFSARRYANGSAQLPGIGDCTSAPLSDQGLGIGDWGLGIALLCETLRERLRSVTRDWGLGIALLCETLRERLRSVTRDWGLD